MGNQRKWLLVWVLENKGRGVEGGYVVGDLGVKTVTGGFWLELGVGA